LVAAGGRVRLLNARNLSQLSQVFSWTCRTMNYRMTLGFGHDSAPMILPSSTEERPKPIEGMAESWGQNDTTFLTLETYRSLSQVLPAGPVGLRRRLARVLLRKMRARCAHVCKSLLTATLHCVVRKYSPNPWRLRLLSRERPPRACSCGETGRQLARIDVFHALSSLRSVAPFCPSAAVGGGRAEGGDAPQ